MFRTLITATDLASHLDDPGWRIIDTRFSLADTQKGRRDYARGHIPGALYAHLDEDLCAARIPGRTGRHPLPEIGAFAKKLGSWGISDGVQVVAYDDSGGAIAARLWWMLHWLGHGAAAVLDGGLDSWLEQGLPLTTRLPQIEPTPFVPRPREWMRVSTAEVAAFGGALVDSRTPTRYRGEQEPIDPVAGHIPGAVNLDHNLTVGPDGHFRDRAALREMFQAVAAAQSGPVFYCGSGVTACRNILAMEHAGLEGARLYAGSWSAWITDPERPVAVGEEQT